MPKESNANASPIVPSASTGGPNGAGPAARSPLDEVAAMLDAREPAASSEPESSPTPPAQGDPENPTPPAESETPGQTDLPPEETTPAEEAAPEEGEQPGEGEPENLPSSDESNELTNALKSLSPTERKAALSLVKELHGGEIPRIGKLIPQLRGAERTIEQLQAENEELKAKVESGSIAAGGAPPAIPETITKLKTVQDVRTRLDIVQSHADSLESWLRTHPKGGEIGNVLYVANAADLLEAHPEGTRISGRFYSAEQIANAKSTEDVEARLMEFKSEARLLPKREDQIKEQVAAMTRQAQARAQLEAELPELKDPEHPEAKAIREMIKSAPWMKLFDSPERAALVAMLGEAALNARIAARKGRPGANGAAGHRPAGKVPLGKPHVAAGGAAVVRANDAGGLASVLERVNKEGSQAALAGLLEITGR